MKRKLASIVLTGAILIGGIGCTSYTNTNAQTNQNNSTSVSTDTKTTSESLEELKGDDIFSKKDKEIGYDETQAKVIKLENKSVTISEEGVYVLSGTISNGQVIVDAPDTAKIRIILNGVNINNDTSAAIYVKKADKVFVTTLKGTTNTLSNKKGFANNTSEEIDAVVYSKEDITFNGEGTININAAYGNALVSKDDLVITSGTYNITAANHGLRGKDSVKIADGIINITAKKDAIHAENNDDTTKGYVYIGGGNITLKSESDAIDAMSLLQVYGGTINITATDDGMHSDDRLIVKGGKINIFQSEEGIEGKKVDIKDGIINIKSKDDGINATSGSTQKNTSTNNNISTNNNSEKQKDTKTDATNIESKDNVNNTSSTLLKNENNKSKKKGMKNGQPQMKSQKDKNIKTNIGAHPNMPAIGENPKMPPMNNGQMEFGRGMFEIDKEAYINISGGNITIDAKGDAIDSNGSLTISGGTTYISGPNSGGNGSLDFNGEGKITGGTIITAGMSGMNQNFGTASTQGSILINNLDTLQKAGTKIEIKNSKGEVIASYVPLQDYNSLLVSTKDIKKGEKYTITVGSYTKTIELTDLIYTEGASMGMREFGEKNLNKN